MLCTKHSDAKLQDLGGGVSRRILAYTEKLMIVEVNFCAGSIGSVHTHPHSQNVYIISGRFRFNVDGQEVEVSAGDSLAFTPNLPHGTVCIETGTLLDIFTPMREDFISK
ncbi:MAG: cupin domain-containing protein [Synergistaceae bacterium]|nr:cupin domain-containing protein [Synergistaceae bacterium]